MSSLPVASTELGVSQRTYEVFHVLKTETRFRVRNTRRLSLLSRFTPSKPHNPDGSEKYADYSLVFQTWAFLSEILESQRFRSSMSHRCLHSHSSRSGSQLTRLCSSNVLSSCCVPLRLNLEQASASRLESGWR